MNNRGAKGTADWQQFEIVLSVPAKHYQYQLRVIHPGNGTAWFDSLAVELDGTPYTEYRIVRFRFRVFRPRGFATGGAGYTVHWTPVSPTPASRACAAPTPEVRPFRARRLPRMRRSGGALESSREAYLSQKFTAEEIDWATQNARIAAQAATWREFRRPGPRHGR